MSNFPVLKKFSILVFCGENILTPDVVEHAGKLWIVPQWLAAYDGTIRPLLMIRFDNLKHQVNALGKDYMLNQPLKKSVLDGTMLEGFETLSGNDVPIYSQENKSLH